MKNIVIRTLGGGSTGYGHFFRCLSLSKAMKKTDSNIKIIFLINDKLENMAQSEGLEYIISNELEHDKDIISKLDIDLFVLDTYLADDDYLRMVKQKAKVMLIDDNNDIYDSSLVDIIYNGNIHADNLDYPFVEGQVRLLGTRYLIMKEEYWDDTDSNLIDKKGILITTGGSDEHRIAIDIIREIKDLDVNIKVIVGPGYKEDYIKEIESEKSENIELIYSPTSLKKYIKESEIVITAGGSTIYEVLSQKSIPVIFSLADNQDMICKELEGRGVCYLGKYPNIEYERLNKILEDMEDKLNNENIFNLVDGRETLKIKKEISI